MGVSLKVLIRKSITRKQGHHPLPIILTQYIICFFSLFFVPTRTRIIYTCNLFCLNRLPNGNGCYLKPRGDGCTNTHGLPYTWSSSVENKASKFHIENSGYSKDDAFAACIATPACTNVALKFADGGTGGGITGMYYLASGDHVDGIATYTNWRTWLLSRASFGSIVAAYLDGGTKKDNVIQNYGAVEHWNVLEVTNMKHAFFGRVHFNSDISKWYERGYNIYMLPVSIVLFLTPQFVFLFLPGIHPK